LPAYARSFEAGHAIPTPPAETIADGVAVRAPVSEAVEIIRRGVARVVTVSEDAIRSAMRAYFTDTHNVAEGAGAVGLAAVLTDRPRVAGKRVAVFLSGGNVDRPVFRDVLAEA
jgi:threonine dehydratase